jgi:hypothetical protein
VWIGFRHPAAGVESGVLPCNRKPDANKMTTREQIESLVDYWDCRREHIFLVISGEESPTGGIPVLWYPEIGVRIKMIEDDDLANAVSAYLFDHGFRRFASMDDLWRAGSTEMWPGWDSCLDIQRARLFDDPNIPLEEVVVRANELEKQFREKENGRRPTNSVKPPSPTPDETAESN